MHSDGVFTTQWQQIQFLAQFEAYYISIDIEMLLLLMTSLFLIDIQFHVAAFDGTEKGGSFYHHCCYLYFYYIFTSICDFLILIMPISSSLLHNSTERLLLNSSKY
jgi:hypothetical protein